MKKLVCSQADEFLGGPRHHSPWRAITQSFASRLRDASLYVTAFWGSPSIGELGFGGTRACTAETAYVLSCCHGLQSSWRRVPEVFGLLKESAFFIAVCPEQLSNEWPCVEQWDSMGLGSLFLRH